MLFSALIALSGVGLAWLMYMRSPTMPAKFAAGFGPLYRLSLNKFYWDEIFYAVLIAPLKALAWISYWFDRTIIDPTVDMVGRIPQGLSTVPRTLHNGLVPSYALVMWTGLILCVLFALRAFS
jgi:NADH-quinone oxidoreductase subunit L